MQIIKEMPKFDMDAFFQLVEDTIMNVNDDLQKKHLNRAFQAIALEIPEKKNMPLVDLLSQTTLSSQATLNSMDHSGTSGTQTLERNTNKDDKNEDSKSASQ